MKNAPSILVARTDRLGDVLLSLPALVTLRAAFPASAMRFLVRGPYAELLRPYLAAQKMDAIVFDEAGAWRSRLRETDFDGAVLLFDEPGLSRELWRSRVPVRVGAYSKPRSFLFLNKGKRQRRASAEHNEAEYNLELAAILAARLGISKMPAAPIVHLPIHAEAARVAGELLRSFGERGGGGWVVAHPGMGGSALNFSALTYRRVLEDLEHLGKRVILSLGPSALDRDLGQALRLARPDWAVVENQSLSVLAEVFRAADLVVAPSTGPLHLAHYVGASTLGIYSPVRTHRPRRWEPWGGAGKSTIWVPNVDCPGTRDCLGPACANYFCLDVMARGGLPSVLRGALTDLFNTARHP